MSNPINAVEKEALRQVSEMINTAATPSIPESLFVNKYLPILTYNTKLQPGEREGHTSHIWIVEVSKHPHALVNVHKDGNPNEILFWVPPILRQLGLNKRPPGLPPLSDEVEKARLEGSVMPRMEHARMQQITEDYIKNDDVTDDANQWNRILKRYGYTDEAEGELSSSTKIVDDTVEIVAVNEL